MGDIFPKALNMSIAASWLILAVVLLRFVLKKAPKWIVVLLWGIVAIRLICPFTIESPASLLPDSVGGGELISEWLNGYVGDIDIHHPDSAHYDAAIGAGREPISDGEGGYYVVTKHDRLGEPTTIKNTVVPILSIMWVTGITVLVLYTVINFWHLRRKVSEAVIFKENILLCDHVRSPFILGLICPRIYLPSGMDAAAMEPVLAHEKAHLARRDHWWKPLGFLILAVHWFNPLCWIAYVLLCRDIEMACDEKVIRQMDLDGKKQYSTALLECSIGRRLVTICPLAFGEIGVKARVKNVLNYKRPAFWIVAAAIVACVAVTVCFATNPKQDLPQEQYTVQARIEEVEEGSLLVAPVEGDSELSSSDLFRVPIANMPPSPEPKAGDIVEIIYDGSILETYPAQFSKVYDMKVISQGSLPEMEDTDTPVAVEPDAAASTFSEEQTAIQKSILGHNRSSETPIDILSCCSFVNLAAVPEPSEAGSEVQRATYYGWALYQEYKVTDKGLETVAGSHTPVALTFEYDDYGYSLLEYWEPRDGSYYAQDIREKFPAHIVEDGIDSQKFILWQTQECYDQAVTYARSAAPVGPDTDQVIRALIETVCGSPAQSSDPTDYIGEHPIEYRELTYYGRYTLEYCFARFEEGGETGLAGHIMMRACEDIAAGWGEEPLVFFLPDNEVLTGQMWYSAFKNNALSLMEQYTEAELAECYPASYLLLSILGEV